MANNELTAKEQAALVRAKADQEAFEAWAKREGVILAVAAMDTCIDGRFPATYHYAQTETAWRAWANKPAAPAQAEPSGALPELRKTILDVLIDRANGIGEDHLFFQRADGDEKRPLVTLADMLESEISSAYAKQAIEARGGALSDAEIRELVDKFGMGTIGYENEPGEYCKHFARAIEARILGQQGGGDAADAARWRALLASERIRPQGSAGLTSEVAPSGEPYNGYAHIGLEIWTKYGRDYSPELLDAMDEGNALGREWLTKYADIAIQAQAGDAKGGA